MTLALEITTETHLVRLYVQEMTLREALVEVQKKRAALVVTDKNGGLALIAWPLLLAGPATIDDSFDL